MSQITKEFSNKVVNMSLLCALLVVSIHCGYSKSEDGVCWWIHQIFSGGYSTIAVPFFFIISGYFLGGHIDENGWWKNETIKRVRTILLPFVSWALLYQILFIPLSIYADIRAGRPFGTNIALINGHALSVFGLELDKWPCSIPLWYLRALFMFVLVSTGIVWILRRIPRTWIILLFTVSLALAFAPDPKEGGCSGFLQHSFSIGGLMYFSVGLWMRMRDFHYNSKKTAIIAAIIGLMLLLIKILLSYKGISLKPGLNSFAIPCFIYATWYFMPTCSLPEILKGVSFPIYLMHSLFLGYWGIFVKNIGLNDSAGKVIAWPLSFIGSIILAKVIHRFSKRLSGILFGGR